MGIMNDVLDWADDHPILATGLAAGGTYAAYKLGEKALGVAERTGKRAINNRYSVRAGKVFIAPCDKQPEEEMIVDETGCLVVEEE